MGKLRLSQISKLFISVFVIYVFWFQYIYGENSIILYGSVGAAALCMAVDLVICDKELESIFPWGILVNLIMCIYSLLTGIFFASNQSLLIEAVKTYFSFSLVSIICCYISKDQENIDWLIRLLIFVEIISAVSVLVKGYYISGYGGYVLGISNNPNTLALQMNIGLFCLAFHSIKYRKHILIYMAIGLIFIYVIIGTASRKNLFASIIISFFWIFDYLAEVWKDKGSPRRFIALFFFILLIGGLYYYITNYYIFSASYMRMKSLGSSAEGSSSHRILYYKYALDYLLENPFFGIGLEQFGVWNPLHQYAHSTYAEALADWGIVGCFIYFPSAILVGFRLLKSYKERKNGLSLIVIAIWIVELFLGVGQIWFYEIDHMIVWTIIYLFPDTQMSEEIVSNVQVRKYKYIRG